MDPLGDPVDQTTARVACHRQVLVYAWMAEHPPPDE